MSVAGDEVHEHVDSDYDEDLAIPDESLETKTDGEITVKLEDTVDFEAALVAIPFQSLHDQPIKFKAPQRNLFIPNAEITVSIINYERNFTRHMLNPNLYTIQFQHGGFSWTVQRRYKDFQHLHNQLKLFRAGLNIPFPTKTHKERRASFKNYQTQNAGKSKGALPRFPSKPEALVPFEQIDRRIQQLTDYLQNLLKINLYRNHYETVNFMEVSNLSFVGDLGAKGKEGFISKRSGSSQPGKKGCNCCGLLDNLICVRCGYLCSDICGTWRNRWLVCKDTWMAWIRPKDGRIRSVMLFDSGFEVSSGVYTTGLHKGLVVVTLCRQVILKCSSQRQSKEWLEFLKKLSYNQAHEFIQQNRHFSFAPVRMDTHAAWFVDGSSYMAAVAEAIEAAREEIYIADWWLSPEIYMKRPPLEGDHWRLDKLLARKACQGVKVFVLLYKEVELALGINSYYSKQRLVAGHHENIKVLRHPDHAKAGVFLWAHHEKVVVIDQTYAFVAGIDLCYGRWDDEVHSEQNSYELNMWKGANFLMVEIGVHYVCSSVTPTLMDANNRDLDFLRRLTDLGSVSQVAGVYQPSKGSQTSSRPSGLSMRRMEVVDIDLKAGEPEGQTTNGIDQVDGTTDIADLPPISEEDAMLASLTPENMKCNTPEMERRRNLLEKVKFNVKSKGKEFMNIFGSSDEEDEEDSEGAISPSPTGTGPTPATSPENKKKRKSPKSPKIPKSHTVKGAEDSVDFIHTEKPVIAPPDEEDVGIKVKPSHFFVEGLSGSAKLWYGKDYTNFIVKDFNNLHMPYQDLVDRNNTPRMPWHDIGVFVQGAAARDVARHFIQRWNAVKMEKAKLNPAYPFLLPKSYAALKVAPFVRPIVNNLKLHNVDCQVLRSASSWSVGFLDSDAFEESIHTAYIDTITRARHYVYVENQFFITQVTQNGKSPVLNRIGEALFSRIMRAHRERKIFRVFVVMPLLPGFEGEVGTPTGTALHAITHYNYASISRGKDSLIQRLKDAGIRDTEEYVSFNGLRKHSELNGGLVTELIYVHSKLLIADDQVVICGSANINDRSMLGKRDSEVAVIINDREFDSSTMAHEPWTAGRFATSLRTQLFKEHLGFTDDEAKRWLGDPASDTFYREFWLSRANHNTAIFEEVFHCIPSDRATTFAALKKYQEEEPLCLTDRTKAERKLEEVKGHLVKLPLEFLSGEILTPNPGSVTGMMPTSLWT